MQRRWATGGAEAENEEAKQVPVSQIQPTPQDEAENAIHQYNNASAQSTEHAAPAAESSQSEAKVAGEPLPDKGAVQSVISTVAETPSSAASAVTQAADLTLNSATGTGVPPSKTSSIGVPKKTIYIGNLFFDVTENDLVKELARFGTISRCRLMRDARGLSKG